MHLLLDVELKAEASGLSYEQLYSWLRDAPAKVGMTRITEPCVALHPPLLIGIVILAESHITVHLDCGTRRGNIDVFTCQAFDHAAVRADVERALGLSVKRAVLLDRGLEYLGEVADSSGVQP